MNEIDANVAPNPWDQLRQYTNARIALGRAGVSTPTREMLEFQLAHAKARDSVLSEADFRGMEREIEALAPEWTCLHLQSQVRDKREYLMRPDRGRLLSEESKKLLPGDECETRRPYDLCFVIADGLSPRAVMKNAVPLLREFRGTIAKNGWSIAPIHFLKYGRVACGDEVARPYRANAVVILIGERPGLSSPESMGAYITYRPVPGVTKDEGRNCISNVHDAGLSVPQAAEKLSYLLEKMFRLRLSGVNLKDDQERPAGAYVDSP